MARVDRNDACPCWSGKKYKRCCLLKDQRAQKPASPAPVAESEMRIPPGAHKWPILRVYVPIEDMWRACGHGSVMVFRGQPNGPAAMVLFGVDISRKGLAFVGGRSFRAQGEIDGFIDGQLDESRPFEEGSIELASKYLWGAWALGAAANSGFPFREAAPYLAFVPKPSGSPKSWVVDLVGPEGLTPRKLVEVVDSIPAHVEDDGGDVGVSTTMSFRLADAATTASLLQASLPDRRGFRFLPNESATVGSFDFVRPIPEGPLSAMPIRGNQQVQGWVDVEDDKLVASALTLSMASVLAYNLRRVLGGGLKLVDADWTLISLKQAAMFGLGPPSRAKRWR